jgi:hypothetical protein
MWWDRADLATNREHIPGVTPRIDGGAVANYKPAVTSRIAAVVGLAVCHSLRGWPAKGMVSGGT